LWRSKETTQENTSKFFDVHDNTKEKPTFSWWFKVATKKTGYFLGGFHGTRKKTEYYLGG
jgi:hypothetical protein